MSHYSYVPRLSVCVCVYICVWIGLCGFLVCRLHVGAQESTWLRGESQIQVIALTFNSSKVLER